MYLYFRHRDKRLSLISSKATSENATTLIEVDVAKRNPKFEIYYIREIHHPDCITYDVGSHTEFYELYNEPQGECKQ